MVKVQYIFGIFIDSTSTKRVLFILSINIHYYNSVLYFTIENHENIQATGSTLYLKHKHALHTKAVPYIGSTTIRVLSIQTIPENTKATIFRAKIISFDIKTTNISVGVVILC